jgi:putative ABC transport system permease protein
VNTVSLAWRNLLRNRRRSLMTLVAMVLGLTTILLFGGFIRDITYGMQSDFVKRTGHLQIQHKDYFRVGSGNPSAYGMVRYREIAELIKTDKVLAPMLTVVTPTLQFSGIAGNFSAGVSRTVFISGVVVDDQRRMREWNDYQQRNLAQYKSLVGTDEDTAVIGTGVARVLQLCAALDVPDCPRHAAMPAASGEALPADIADLADATAAPTTSSSKSGPPRIEILAANAKGAPNVAAVKVLHAEFQGVKELDDVYVGLHLAQAQKLVFGAAPPQATALQLQLVHTAQIPAARERLEELMKTTLKDEPLGVIDYETLNPFYGQTLSMFAAIFGFIAVLIGAIVLFTVANTMSMAVVERTSEIGTLRAIGLRRKGIRAMFVCEGVLLGFFGALLGIGAALLLSWLMNQLDLSWVPPGRVEPVALAVRVAGEGVMMLGSAVALVIVAALSAILPAARAARMNIVDALRHV